MGADIHIIAEVKENGKWKRNKTPVFKNSYYREEEKNKDEEEQRKTYLHEFLSDPPRGRNYSWFAILANVRNRHGFSFIAAPRGLPDDISKESLKYFCLQVSTDIRDEDEFEDIEDENGNCFVTVENAQSWIESGYSKARRIDTEEYVTNPDYHSLSYLYLKDFDNFDWNQTTYEYGLTPIEEYKKMKEIGVFVESSYTGVFDSNCVTVNTEIADRILADEVLDLKQNDMFSNEKTIKSTEAIIMVNYKWPILYSEIFKYQIESTVNPMRKLKEQFEDVRIIFSFDN